jgi:hypothetical protein
VRPGLIGDFFGVNAGQRGVLRPIALSGSTGVFGLVHLPAGALSGS